MGMQLTWVQLMPRARSAVHGAVAQDDGSQLYGEWYLLVKATCGGWLGTAPWGAQPSSRRLHTSRCMRCTR
jgi:hypothetical protein